MINSLETNGVNLGLAVQMARIEQAKVDPFARVHSDTGRDVSGNPGTGLDREQVGNTRR
jgi:hypothetical protein